MMASGLAVLCGYFSGGSTSTPAGCMTPTLNSIQTACRATPPGAATLAPGSLPSQVRAGRIFVLSH